MENTTLELYEISTIVPSLVTNSFHTQQTQEVPHPQQQQPQQQQPQNHPHVVTSLNGGSAITGCGLSPMAASSNPNGGGISSAVALHRPISVGTGLEQSTEHLQSLHPSNASSFSSYAGYTIPNQSEYFPNSGLNFRIV